MSTDFQATFFAEVKCGPLGSSRVVLSVCVSPFQVLNHLPGSYEICYEHYGTGSHLNLLHF